MYLVLASLAVGLTAFAAALFRVALPGIRRWDAENPDRPGELSARPFVAGAHVGGAFLFGVWCFSLCLVVVGLTTGTGR